MKRSLALLGVLLLAGIAWAAAATIGSVDDSARWMKNGFFAGTTAGKTSTNRVSAVYSGSLAFDFASVTITCEDSTGITVTGAVAGDACFVGAPTTISGAGTGLHSSFTCYVSAADTVKVRHCAAGTADNPASATYYVRVISAQ